ncbi:MAG: hypothetical protein R3E77_14690 [Steroidobacteraceae bacterium]
MSARPVHLDFIEQPRRRSVAGLLASVTALACLLATAYWAQSLGDEAQGLELRLAALQPAATKDGASAERQGRVSAALQAAIGELNTPWSELLGDLEAATKDSHDDIALLAIEPDREHGNLRLAAEARSLPAALAYVQRLQHCATLRMPVLDHHEIQVKERERPVRFQVTARWSAAR